MRLRWWLVTLMGFLVLALVLIINLYYSNGQLSLSDFFQYGFKFHLLFWKYYVIQGVRESLYFLYKTEVNYLIAFGLIASGVMGVIDYMFRSPHQDEIEALKKGKLMQAEILPESIVTGLLDNLNHSQFNGTVLGVSQQTGHYVVIDDAVINQIVLVLGTTGAGKTISLRRFYEWAIRQGYPLIIIDGKPTHKNVEWVRRLAQQFNRPFNGFNCSNYRHYDALTHGGYTELKDKVISLKDQWESDYYRSIAEDYLQTTFEVLIKSGKKFDLKQVAACLDYDELCVLAREIENPALLRRVKSLEGYGEKDIRGLQAHLHILVHSELGEYFELDESVFTLADVIAQNGIVYFALPALKFPAFSKVLGKLVINDLKAVIAKDTEEQKKIFAIFDEFSVFAGEQSLNLVNMGREKGLHSIYGTQGLAEMDKVEKTFRQQLMNCVNTLICHRLNDHTDAEEIANWVGTQDKFKLTAQVTTMGESNMGSVRTKREFTIHPDAIKKELGTGEVFYVSKVGGFKQDRVKVKYS
jgi:conjugal transfer pilus assembly protein TraD